MAIFQQPFTGGQVPASGSNDKMDVGSSSPHKWISERHVACVFILDTSGSMSGFPIESLNAGLRTFKEQTVNDKTFDEHTKACIDVALVSFGGTVKIEQPFCPVEDMMTPTLTSTGGTPMGEALDVALDMIAQQKEQYKAYSTPYYRPWVFCITDGEPNDDYAGAVQRLKELERKNKVLGYCVGVEGFNKDLMGEIFDKSRIFTLDNLDFTGLFQFISSSLASVRNSDPNSGNTIETEAPNTIKLAF